MYLSSAVTVLKIYAMCFLSKDEAISNIIGLAPATMNTLERISKALDDDENFFNNNQIKINQKTNLIYVNNQLLLKTNIEQFNFQTNILINMFN